MKTVMRWRRWLTAMIWAGLGCGLAAATTGEPAMASPAGGGEVLRTVGLAGAAAVAIGLSVLGAGFAVARIGAAALGTAAERPELMMRSLMFVALAEGLAVLGFAVAMLLLQKI